MNSVVFATSGDGVNRSNIGWINFGDSLVLDTDTKKMTTISNSITGADGTVYIISFNMIYEVSTAVDGTDFAADDTSTVTLKSTTPPVTDSVEIGRAHV